MLKKLSLIGLSAVFMLLIFVGTVTAANIVERDATQEALAMLTTDSQSTLVEASFSGVESQVNTSTLHKQTYPTDENSYVVLSTGNSSQVFSGNASTFISNYLYGRNFTDAHPRQPDLDTYDVATLSITLNVPSNANTLTFDWQYGSEEIPTFIGTSYMDYFTAKLTLPSGYTKEITNMPNGEVPTVDTIVDFVNMPGGSSSSPEPPYPIPNDVALNALTTAGTNQTDFTPFVSVVDVSPYQGQQITIVFEIGDAGDDMYDSAVFMDSLGFDVVTTTQTKLQLVQNSLEVNKVENQATLNVGIANPSDNQTITTNFNAYTGVKWDNGTVSYTVEETKSVSLSPLASTDKSFNVTIPSKANMSGYYLGVKRFDVPPQSAKGVSNQYQFYSVTTLSKVTVTPQTKSLGTGSTGKISLILNEVPPEGFSYANFTVSFSNSSVAEFEDVEFPDWAGAFKDNSSLPSSTIWFKGGDYDNEVTAGQTDVVLANLTFKANSPGDTDVVVTANSIQDDSYSETFLSTQNGYISVTPATSNIIVSPPTKTLAINSTGTLDIVIDQVPTGLSFANLTVDVANSSVAQIESISYPSWAGLSNNSYLPSSAIWFKEGDLDNKVSSGDTNVVLATVTIKALGEGASDIDLTVNSFEDDSSSEIKGDISTSIGTVSVVAGPSQIGGNQPQDTDGDGLFDDVDGSDSFNFGDVIFFFQNFDSNAVENNKQFFDFDGDGNLTFGDVIGLFQSL